MGMRSGGKQGPEWQTEPDLMAVKALQSYAPEPRREPRRLTFPDFGSWCGSAFALVKDTPVIGSRSPQVLPWPIGQSGPQSTCRVIPVVPSGLLTGAIAKAWTILPIAVKSGL